MVRKMFIENNILKHYLKNVYFITGTAYAGKSTMVKILAEKYDLIFCGENYTCDITDKVADPDIQPNLCFMNLMNSWEDFVKRSPEEYEKWMYGTSDEVAGFEIADTNIKWNEFELKDEQIDFANLSNNPDQVDFKQDTKDIDVVYEIMLRQKNIPLSSKIEVLDEIGSRTYLYADSYLICLETQVTNEMIDKLASLDPTPFKYIFRDSAFKDDIDLKTNAFRRLKAMVEKHAGATKKAYTVEFI